VKRLLLLRHAKAVPGGAKVDDHGRELAARGRSDAPTMGRYMRKHDFVPDLVLCSTSKRTIETAELVFGEFREKPDTEFVEALYLAEADALIAAVRAVSDACESVCFVGHNPGMEVCAGILARDPVKRKEKDALDALEEKFPTCALAILDFDLKRWRDMEPGTGMLIDFVRPRDL
jgi:phosphohistidine phosphatase